MSAEAERAELERAIQSSIRARFGEQLQRLGIDEVAVTLNPQNCEISLRRDGRPSFSFSKKTPEKAIRCVEAMIPNILR